MADKEKTYNLQVPIDLGLAEILKQLAKEDDRNLRAYCKRILQDHVKNLGKEIQVITTVTEPSKEEMEITVEVQQETTIPKKKNMVGKLNRK